MTRSVYVVGGAGAGKSTFTSRLLGEYSFGPLTDLHTAQNSRGSNITLRGHMVEDDLLLYLGVMREAFPGTDGLDRVSSVAGVPWLAQGNLPRAIYGEGNTLANRPFLKALAEHTDLVIIHIWVPEEEQLRRVGSRGHDMDEKWVLGTSTRALNLASEMEGLCDVWYVRGDLEGEQNLALAVAKNHLLPGD